MATKVARAEETAARSDVMRPLFAPWFELEDAKRAEAPRKRGFWRSVGQFLFDYNRF